MFQADWEAHPPALIIDMSTVVPDWRIHPHDRYPAPPGVSSRISGGGRDQWRNNLSSALAQNWKRCP